MSFEEEFDKIVRAKAEEENYPFDERNWEKASALIASDRKAARVLKLKKFYFPALLVIGLGTAGIVAYSLIKSDEREISVLALAPVTTNSNPSPSAAQVEINNLNTKVAGKEQTKNSGKNKVQENASEKSLSVNQMTSRSTFESSKTPSDKINSTTTTKFASVVLQQKNELPEKPLINDAAGLGTGSDQSDDPENVVLANDESAVPSKNEKISSDVAPLANTGISDKNEFKENTGETTAESISAETRQFVSEQLVSVNSNLPHETADREILATPFTVLSRYDDDYYRNHLKKTHYLNIEAGANYLMGWDTRDGKDAKGLNWFGGLNYGFYLTQKVSLGMGVQAYNISHIKQAFYMNELKEYSFGSSTSYTVISSNDLYYLAVPLKINYHLNASNTIGFGVNAAYLMSAANTVSTYSLNQENGASLPVSMRNTCIYEGTRLTNLMLSAHYKAKLTKRMNVNAELNYGLTDIFENKGSITNKETPLGLRLSLQYTLFDK